MLARSGMEEIVDIEGALPALITDWREKNNCCGAFFLGKLVDTDYRVIIFLTLAFLFLLAMAISTTFVAGSMKYGCSIAVLILVLSLYGSPLIEYFSTGENFHPIEMFSLFLATVVNFGYGVLYVAVEFDGWPESDSERLNVVFLTFLFPVLVAYGSAFYSWHLSSWEMKRFTIYCLILAQVACILFAIAVGVLVNWLWGGILFAIFLIIACFVAIMIRYTSNGFYLPFVWKGFAMVMTVIVCAVGIVIGVLSDGLGIFLGFSITYFSIAAFMALYCLQIFINDYRTRNIAPIFFSPWVFPIYKYNPRTEKMARHNTFGALLFILIMMLLVWSVLCTIWITPVYVGVAIGSLSEVLIALFGIYIAGISPMQLGIALSNI
jgi:hypothetical protein